MKDILLKIAVNFTIFDFVLYYFVIVLVLGSLNLIFVGKKHLEYTDGFEKLLLYKKTQTLIMLSVLVAVFVLIYSITGHILTMLLFAFALDYWFFIPAAFVSALVYKKALDFIGLNRSNKAILLLSVTIPLFDLAVLLILRKIIKKHN